MRRVFVSLMTFVFAVLVLIASPLSAQAGSQYDGGQKQGSQEYQQQQEDQNSGADFAYQNNQSNQQDAQNSNQDTQTAQNDNQNGEQYSSKS
ncbi:MAG: hypothetical protein AAGF24_13530 [Cyanobacteria bacterium P01_H01_bin.121]